MPKPRLIPRRVNFKSSENSDAKGIETRRATRRSAAGHAEQGDSRQNRGAQGGFG
jgi:hypothetical protein